MGKAITQSVRSMTGFGTAECVEMGWHFAVDIRSVNGRFLDFSLRCPEEIRQIEAWLREQINAATQRGKLEMRIQVRRQHAAPEALQINEKLMANLLSLVSDIKAELQDVAAVSPLDLLQFPGMILDASHVDQDFLHEIVKRLTPMALKSLAESREAEGERLASFLRQRLNAIRDLCTTLEAQLPHWSIALERRLKERLASLGLGIDAKSSPIEFEPTAKVSSPHEGKGPLTDAQLQHSLEFQQRIAQELGLFAIKSDVAEELSRLRAHSDAIDEILNRGGACGKRLDFMMQELQREANTLGSKSHMLEQSRASVDLKVLIEQMREQVQNLE